MSPTWVTLDLPSSPPRESRWRDLAACAGTDPDAFFPESTNANDYACRVCARCDVRSECLAWALAHNEVGTWGGMSENARRRLAAKRRAAGVAA